MEETRVFIYPNSSSAARLATCTNSRRDKDLFETKLPALLSASVPVPGAPRWSAGRR